MKVHTNALDTPDGRVRELVIEREAKHGLPPHTHVFTRLPSGHLDAITLVHHDDGYEGHWKHYKAFRDRNALLYRLVDHIHGRTTKRRTREAKCA